MRHRPTRHRRRTPSSCSLLSASCGGAGPHRTTAEWSQRRRGSTKEGRRQLLPPCSGAADSCTCSSVSRCHRHTARSGSGGCRDYGRERVSSRRTSGRTGRQERNKPHWAKHPIPGDACPAVTGRASSSSQHIVHRSRSASTGIPPRRCSFRAEWE